MHMYAMRACGVHQDWGKCLKGGTFLTNALRTYACSLLRQMGRVVLLSLLLLLAAVNVTLVHCSKGNSTAAKYRRCSACQIFVQELHAQMSKSADTQETILKQVMPVWPCPPCVIAVLVKLSAAGCNGLQAARALRWLHRSGQ